MDELDTSGAFFSGVARAVGRAAAAVVDKINFTCLKKRKKQATRPTKSHSFSVQESPEYFCVLQAHCVDPCAI